MAGKAQYRTYQGNKASIENRNGKFVGTVCGHYHSYMIMAVEEGPDGWKPGKDIKPGIEIMKDNPKGYLFVTEKDVL